MSIIQDVSRVTRDCIRDRDEPKDLIIFEGLRPMLMSELNQLLLHPVNMTWDTFMGMRIEWTLTDGISIRTTSGDVRRVE